MTNYAVVEGNKVINVIVADSKEIAEEATNKMCVEYTLENPAGIDWTYDGVNFIKPQPYPSWTLDSEYDWQPPTAYPAVEDNSDIYYEWDEPTTSWKATPITREQ